MLDTNPDTRISAAEILNHSWITDNEKLVHNFFYDTDKDPSSHEESMSYGSSAKQSNLN